MRSTSTLAVGMHRPAKLPPGTLSAPEGESNWLPVLPALQATLHAARTIERGGSSGIARTG
jgi:hypothetical protein